MKKGKKLKLTKTGQRIIIILLAVVIICTVAVTVILKRKGIPQDENRLKTLSELWANSFHHNIQNNEEDSTVENFIPYEMSENIFPDMDYDTKVNTIYPQDEIQMFLDNEVSHENSEADYLGKRMITGDSVPYDGQERSITCWGDSMTEGNGTGVASITVNGEEKDISNVTFPSELQELTGITTYNLGVGGETSIQIAQRAGGLKMVTDRNLNVPSSGGVRFNLLSPEYNNMSIDINDYSGYGQTIEREINRVYVDGNKYKITFNGETHMIFKKLSHKNPNKNPMPVAANSTYISAGTQVYTAASIERKNDILVIEMGSNGGWENFEELIQQYDSIIAFANCKYYIIIGDTDDPDYAAGLGDTPWEAALRKAYGNHFINMRTYLIQNGLNDCGLDTTYADMECYYNGQISKQLRADWTHLNAYGYYTKGLAIYQKGVELGYWK